jgi:hypothetical protein
MGAGLLAVKSGFILFIKNYQFPIQIKRLRERERRVLNFVYYESIKRKLKIKCIYECRMLFYFSKK